MFSFKPPPPQPSHASVAPAAPPARAPETIKCLRCALHHAPMLRRSLKASLLVGSILTVLNQGDVLFSGGWSTAFYWKIPLTYCVPFMVASYGALVNNMLG